MRPPSVCWRTGRIPGRQMKPRRKPFTTPQVTVSDHTLEWVRAVQLTDSCRAPVGPGRTDLVRLLVEKGASVNAQSEAGPPLLFAIGHGHTEAVRTLLELGADPTAANEDGVTSLLTAAAAQETEIVEMLIKVGMGWGGGGGPEEKPLTGVGGGLQGGADVHSAAGAGVTPLFVAANEGNLRMLNALLEGGADPNTKDEVSISRGMHIGHLAGIDTVGPQLEVIAPPPPGGCAAHHCRSLPGVSGGGGEAPANHTALFRGAL